MTLLSDIAGNQIAGKRYTSPEQVITSAGTLTLQHKLGAEPVMIRAYLVCKVANLGYAVGEHVPVAIQGLNYNASLLNYGMAATIDSININIKFASNTNTFLVTDSTGNTNSITNTAWRLVIVATASVVGIPQQRLTLATPIATTSGTAHDFAGIPAGTKRITVMFDGVSTNGTSLMGIQLGDAGGFEATGYAGTATTFGFAAVNMSTFFPLLSSQGVTSVLNGSVVFTLMDATTNTWACNGSLGFSDSANITSCAGSKSLTSELTQLRLTTSGGVNTFDAGKVNISYE